MTTTATPAEPETDERLDRYRGLTAQQLDHASAVEEYAKQRAAIVVELRDEGWTLQRLASALGVSKTMIASLEAKGRG